MNTVIKPILSDKSVIFKSRKWDVSKIVKPKMNFLHVRHCFISQTVYAVIFDDDGTENLTALIEMKEVML